MRRLKALPFEKWVAHVFDHEVRDPHDPQWYFDADAPVWVGSAELEIIGRATRRQNDRPPELAAYARYARGGHVL